MLNRITGACLSLYAAVYTAQAVFSRFYVDLLDPQEVWDVLNYITAVGILIIIAAALDLWRKSQDDPESLRHLTSQVRLYASVALAIIYYPLWFSLIMGDTQSEANNVGWILVSVLNPIMLAVAGRELSNGRQAG